MRENSLAAAILAVSVLAAAVFFKDANILWFWLIVLFIL